MPQRFRRLPGRPFGRVLLALLIVSWTPAGAATGQPSWWVRALAAAERRFSLTSEVFSERQESLRIAAFDQFLEVIDPQTGEVHGSRLPGDPALLNRKFDVRFEQQGVGSGFSVALPRLGVLYPTLGFDAAEAEVELDFHDITEPRESTSLRGRGALFDTRLDLVAIPCRHCAWFTAIGYGFEKLPSFAVDRSPRFELQGFSVSRDDVRLEREVHEISSRVGYAPLGGRTTSFVGVQHRWTDLEIDDRIAYRGPLSDSRLSSHTRLESEATLALAGLHVELGSRWSGRLETAVGDGDSIVWLGFAFQPSSGGGTTPIDRYGRLAQEIASLRTEFAQEIASLPQTGWAAAAMELLDRFEERLLALLPPPEFDALRSLVLYRFDRARERLAAGAQREASTSADDLHPGYVAASLALLASSTSSGEASRGLRDIFDLLTLLERRIRGVDLRILLCVRTAEKESFTVQLLLWRYAKEDDKGFWLRQLPSGSPVKRFNTNKSGAIDRGAFWYFAWRHLADDRTDNLARCPGDEHCDALDLAGYDHPVVVCDTADCHVEEGRAGEPCSSTPP